MDVPEQGQSRGRRRCLIPEHRKQIRALQRWAGYLQSGHMANWHRIREREAELRAVRAEFALERTRLHELLCDLLAVIDPDDNERLCERVLAETSHCDGVCSAPKPVTES
jgi:hypothetical protein